MLRVGVTYHLTDIRLPKASAFRRQLLSMGLTPGVKFKVVRQAPFGGPWVIKLRGGQISLRSQDLGDLVWEKVDG